MTETSFLPLKGLKVMDLSTVLAGPSVATFLAELGAEVIKIEHPVLGDVTRSWKLPSESESSEISAYFSSVNYLKSYLKLNLLEAADRKVLLEKLKDTDVLLSNFKHGDAGKFQLTDDFLTSFNPRLIVGKISGFGDESDRVAYDLVLQAETGFMSMNGTAESGPVKMPVALIDVLAAHHLKEAVLLALYQREKTQIGAIVSVSLYDAAVASLANQASNFLMEHHIPQRIGSLHPNIAPYGELFETKDGAIITFAIGSSKHFVELCKCLNLSELLDDKRFEDNQKRVKNRTELAKILGGKIKEFEAQALLIALQQKGVPCAKIKNLKEVFEEDSAQKMVREEWISGRLTKRMTSIAFKWK
jgi:crotonobetainyl-CoA:carnitine CoA-transferase CaiB-like acyl-CoA transferase